MIQVILVSTLLALFDSAAHAADREGTPLEVDTCYNVSKSYNILNGYSYEERQVLKKYTCSMYAKPVPIKEHPGWVVAGVTDPTFNTIWSITEKVVLKHEICHAITLSKSFLIDAHGVEWKACMRSHGENKEADRYINHDDNGLPD